MGFFSKGQCSSSKACDAKQERTEQASSSAPPPAYESDDALSSVSQDAPDYVRPRFHQEGSAMALLPPVFHVYASWKSMSKLHIGLSKDDQRYLVTCSWNIFSSKSPLVIHNGLSADDQPLVEVGPVKAKASQDHVITVHSRAGRPGPPLNVDAGFKAKSWRQWNITFTVPILAHGEGGEQLPLREEEFQWRTTTGEEVRLVTGGNRWSSGWKLVWLTGPELGDGVGFGGDGCEVVAVAAGPEKAMMNVLRLVYMGTGLTGTLGADWEAVVAASALQLWWYNTQTGAVTSLTV